MFTAEQVDEMHCPMAMASEYPTTCYGPTCVAWQWFNEETAKVRRGYCGMIASRGDFRSQIGGRQPASKKSLEEEYLNECIE